MEEDEALDVGVKLEPLVDRVRVGERAKALGREAIDRLGELPL